MVKVARLTVMFESDYEAKNVGIELRGDLVCLLFPLSNGSWIEVCLNEAGAKAVKNLLELYLKSREMKSNE